MSDLIDRQAAIDALDVLCQEHRYRIPGKRETYSQYNEAWQDALDRAESIIGNLPSAQPEIIRCKDCEFGEQDEVGRWFCRSLGCQIGNEDGSGYCADAERRTDE